MNKKNKIKKTILSIAVMFGISAITVFPVVSEPVSVASAVDFHDLDGLKFGDNLGDFTGADASTNTATALNNGITFIKWISTAGAILLLGVFVVNLLKVGSSGTNVQARAAAQQGLVWSGIAAAALSISSTIFFFIQGALRSSGE